MKYIKQFESKKNYLEEYAKFILSQYIKSNSNYNNTRIYFRLIEFIETHMINNLITKNDKLEHKIQILDDLRYNILIYMEEYDLNTDYLINYNEFINFKNSGLTIYNYIKSKKYNL